ncbi:crossover junction endodeoxyribonuclease RuvC [Clostridium sp. JN-9]|uniref:crossover junction endodeoxyribonuclease RuvC n=1 Tax=Clostridium sp. JN-9 TaxID=2507159 RepID=UPI0013E8E299|nr:crossover junction endodeoxyribonuclease RuvC [Clostridium sp. JN-9]
MKTVGIDVGTNNLAISVFNNTDLQCYKLLENKKTLAPGAKLINIEKFLEKIFEDEKPDAVVVEGTFWNPREARGYSYVSSAIGIIQMVSWKVLHIEPIKLQPSTVKKIVTGNGRAKKEEVADVVKNRFKITEDLADHLTDSIAIGYTFLIQQNVKKEVM